MNVPQYEDHLPTADYAFGNLDKTYVNTGIPSIALFHQLSCPILDIG